MAEPSREPKIGDVVTTGNGAGPGATAPRYCGFCGKEADPGQTLERFGEAFCSEAHAGEFVKGVREARVRAAAVATDGAPAEQQERMARPGAAKPWDWKSALKMAACCGAPLLALVVLAGGGGALLGAAGSLLPLLALLACPLGMFFMMRAMSKGHQQQPKDNEQDK